MGKNDKGYVEVSSGARFKLSKAPVAVKPRYHSEEHYRALLDADRVALGGYQTLLYAEHSKAMLLIFQGMDTSGKDGAIKHVLSGINPQGCVVVSFKTPTSIDIAHDYLWRTHRLLPARGQIGIFNRSYYEDVLVTRVHPELLSRQNLPTGKHGKKFWTERFKDIVHHEDYLMRQGYEIVKFFIHISKAEQKKRLLSRFQNKKKEWKISEGDVRERSFWSEYQDAYEECFRNTGTKECPWHIIPGNDKRNARLIVSKIIVERFGRMNLKYPSLRPEERKKLTYLKATLDNE
ncbi:MAG: polyphosphate kinase 2 family protein [Nitrospinae bacterium]|nr:polyphosphate kinase 2 family protein [Nitrospinota bacterium]